MNYQRTDDHLQLKLHYDFRYNSHWNALFDFSSKTDCFDFKFELFPLPHLTEDLMRRCTAECEEAIGRGDAQSHVDGTSQIARLANRVLMVAKQEADNSEDQAFIGRVNDAANVLQTSMLLICIRSNLSFHRNDKLIDWFFKLL